MTTLNIEGQKVKVSDDFLSLSPEDQNKTVEEIAGQMKIQAGPKHPVMSQVNKGIAESVGGLVDFVNPFDGDEFGFSTGSAQTGIEGLMERGGVEVAQGDPETKMQGFARGSGQAAGGLLPVAKGLQTLKSAGGAVGQFADDALNTLASTLGVSTEIVAGGISGAAEEAAEQAGAPEWVQNTAAIAAPISAAGVLSATKGTAKAVANVTPAGVLARRAKAAMAPYTKSGATEVARDRVQNLAGGPERADKLASQIGGDNPLNLTPAQQTQDPNLLAVEQLAADQDPNLRVALQSRARAGQDEAKGAFQAGDAQDAQAFFSKRRADFTQRLQAEADAVMQGAQERVAGVANSRTETQNSLTVSREINEALERSLQQERDLWSAIPRAERVPTDQAKEAAGNILEEIAFAQKGDVPQAVRDLLSNPDTYGRDATVKDMHGLYSELRRQARTAMAGNDQNKNKARIANSVAEAILKDLGATDGATQIGQQINEARAFSSALHDTFDKGAPGRLLRRTLDGDTAIDPELALKRTVGRGGAEAAVASEQMERAGGPQTPAVVQDYIKGLFNRRVSPTGEFKSRQAALFVRDNKELLARYPELRKEIDDAVAQGEDATQMAERVTRRISALTNAKSSTTQAFVNMPPQKAITAVLDAKNPAQAASKLANEARKDKSGKALAGVKGAFSDYLINTVSKVKAGDTAMSGDAMLQVLQQPKTKAALSRIYTPAELNRLNMIASELAKLNNAARPAANIGESLSGAKVNRFIEIPLRIMAANFGAKQGSSGASLQTAQMASSRMKEAMNHLASDKASQMIAEAVTDPDLFRALLTGTKVPNLEERVMPRLVPYLIGGASAAVSQE